MEQRNKEINEWLESHQTEIQNGEIQVFAADECHVQGGDICGYGWGNRKERMEVEIKNYRNSQTYYGAVNCISGELFLKDYKKANGEQTISFVRDLVEAQKGAKVVLIWDGATYHHSQEFRNYLAEVNSGDDWKVHCLKLAPNAPQENPIENIWGQVKKILAQMYQRCKSFSIAKRIFELIIRYKWYELPDLSKYGAFSSLI